MSTFRNVIACIGIGTFGIVHLTQAAPPTVGPVDVTVTNGADMPVPVTIQNATQQFITEYRYIGLTGFETDGSVQVDSLVGIAAMNNKCAEEFGAEARLATTSEAHFRTDSVDTRSGWVLPTAPIIVAVNNVNGHHRSFDALSNPVGFFSSAAGPVTQEGAVRTAACARYDYGGSDNSGPVVTPQGEIVLDECDETWPISCSAPFSIPAYMLPN